MFVDLTDATDITNNPASGGSQFKMAFDGCGMVYGTRGSLFAHGLKKQCNKVVHRVQKFLNHNHTVCLNCLGLSRGGIAVLYLIQKLSHYDLRYLRMNVLLFDP